MEISDIVQRYVDHYGLCFIKGGANDIAPLMPFLIMDVGYHYYSKYIMPLNLSFEMQRARTGWKDNYNTFNHILLAVFPDINEQIEITDMMDSLAESMCNDLVITMSAAMSCFDELPFENQKVLASAIMTNMLADKANGYWMAVYRCRNRYISGVIGGTRKFSREYLKSLGALGNQTTDKKADNLKKCGDMVGEKILSWYSEHKHHC